MLVFMDEKDVTNMITIVMTIMTTSWCRTFGIKRGPHTGEERSSTNTKEKLTFVCRYCIYLFKTFKSGKNLSMMVIVVCHLLYGSSISTSIVKRVVAANPPEPARTRKRCLARTSSSAVYYGCYYLHFEV